DVTYYSDPLAVPANLIEKTEGVFFTVQVGVYGKPSRNTILNTYSDLHVEKLQNGQIRYTSGKFQTIPDVIKQRSKKRIRNSIKSKGKTFEGIDFKFPDLTLG
ncbi:MAG: hypothetical protein NWP82_07275, partial [Flavobacteriales bacterium]|nr:hypothetical protein [Flavobacteriales bacterium]